jgi:hypothetical protein
MDRIRQLLDRRARWQKDRKNLPWPEKIRMVEAIRDEIVRLRATASLRRDSRFTDQRKH